MRYRRMPAVHVIRYWAELLKGAERSTGKSEVVHPLEALARQVAVLCPTGPAICEHYAEQLAHLKDAGQPIAASDLWIAYHAPAESATLVTHNTREFPRVDGLRVKGWVASAESLWLLRPYCRLTAWAALLHW